MEMGGLAESTGESTSIHQKGWCAHREWNRSTPFLRQSRTASRSKRTSTEGDSQLALIRDEKVSIDQEVPRWRCTLPHLP